MLLKKLRENAEFSCSLPQLWESIPTALLYTVVLDHPVELELS